MIRPLWKPALYKFAAATAMFFGHRADDGQ